jgi:16S rRNA (cytosine967-C5)-methyltransferase
VRLEEIQRLRRAQLGLIEQAAGRLRAGGVLVYSTCSLEPEENRGVVDSFLEAQPGFSLELDRELFPPDSQTDGAYAAVLRKSG